MSPRERELSELLGAYALDAVDAHERAEIDEYLTRSPRARAEVAEHMEVAALLGGTVGEAPASIWDRIHAMLPADEPHYATDSLDEAHSVLARSLRSVPTVAGRERVAEPVIAPRALRRWAVAVCTSAAAAAIIVGLGVSNVRQDRLIKDYKAELVASRTGAQRLNDLLATPGTRVATLRNDSGDSIARVVLASSGEGYMVDSGLPHLKSGHTYQLWGVENGQVLSLGVMADSDRPIPLAARGTWSKLVITEEISPGVVTSGQPAVAAGVFSS